MAASLYEDHAQIANSLSFLFRSKNIVKILLQSPMRDNMDDLDS